MDKITLPTKSLSSTWTSSVINSSVFHLPSALEGDSVSGTAFDYMEYNESEGTPSKPNDNHIFQILCSLLYSIGFLLGVAGNGVVIWIAGFRMKKMVNTVWFLNLAIADFTFTVFLPFSIAYTAMGFHWPFSKIMCKLNSTMVSLNMFASVFFLMAISVDRCVSVINPVWAQNHRTPRLASFIALGIWASALMVSWPTLMFRTTSSSTGGENIVCYNDFGLPGDLQDKFIKLNRYTVIISVRFVLGFLLPFSVIAVCYAIIATKLNQDRMAASSKPFKIIIAVIICFFLCWFPFHVISFLELSNFAYGEHHQGVVSIGMPVCSSLAFLNSCINPIIYVFNGRAFRESFRLSIITVFENAFNDVTAQPSSASSRLRSISRVESQL
ncbi:chemerin-like receptor 1 [Pleurodeles waltl]|uniref:chemerin-like receptor 1 n=1 Tax=Pleurodeles waltl TaxID=8319 RepID=UPI0037098586